MYFLIAIHTFITQYKIIDHKEMNYGLSQDIMLPSPIRLTLIKLGTTQIWIIFYILNLLGELKKYGDTTIAITIGIYLTMVIYELINADKTMVIYKDRI